MDRERRKMLSTQRVAGWNNTLEAVRAKKERARTENAEKEEEAMRKLDAQVPSFGVTLCYAPIPTVCVRVGSVLPGREAPGCNRACQQAALRKH